jgi:hypothetical protein
MSDKDVARIVRPENRIKKKIGADVNLREILQPDVLQSAQQIIMDKKDGFLIDAKESLLAMEGAYSQITAHVATETNLSLLLREAASLRDRSGTFGYHLGSDIAKSLARYTEQTSASNEHLAVVMRKHLDGLQIVFRQNVTDSGGAIGMELLDGLRKLIEKYPAAASQ